MLDDVQANRSLGVKNVVLCDDVELALLTSLFAVPPMPLRGLFPCNVSKKIPLCMDFKILMMDDGNRLRKFLQFLYCNIAPLLKSESWIAW